MQAEERNMHIDRRRYPILDYPLPTYNGIEYPKDDPFVEAMNTPTPPISHKELIAMCFMAFIIVFGVAGYYGLVADQVDKTNQEERIYSLSEDMEDRL